MPHLHDSPTAILSTLTTATGAGDWYRIHPKMGPLSLQAIFTGSSVGYLGTAGVKLEVSNDGINPNTSAVGTMTFTTVATPVADGITLDAGWQYIRANITALTSSTLSVGLNSLGVIASGRFRS